MSRLNMRPRPIDTNRPLPISFPDDGGTIVLDDGSVVDVGMFEDYREGMQVERKFEIPIPVIRHVEGGDKYPKLFQRPHTYIRYRPDREKVEYDLDSDDERFMSIFNRDRPQTSHLTPDELERVIDRFERITGLSKELPTLPILEPQVRTKPVEAFRPLYEHWKAKRLSRRQQKYYPVAGKPLLMEFEIAPDMNDPNPFIPFRPREKEKKEVKKARKNDAASFFQMKHLRGELEAARRILKLTIDRETVKREIVASTRDAFEGKLSEPSKARARTKNVVAGGPQGGQMGRGGRPGAFPQRDRTGAGLFPESSLDEMGLSDSVLHPAVLSLHESVPQDYVSDREDRDSEHAAAEDTDHVLDVDTWLNDKLLAYQKSRKRPLFAFHYEMRLRDTQCFDPKLARQIDQSRRARMGRGGRVILPRKTALSTPPQPPPPSLTATSVNDQPMEAAGEMLSVEDYATLTQNLQREMMMGDHGGGEDDGFDGTPESGSESSSEIESEVEWDGYESEQEDSEPLPWDLKSWEMSGYFDDETTLKHGSRFDELRSEDSAIPQTLNNCASSATTTTGLAPVVGLVDMS